MTDTNRRTQETPPALAKPFTAAQRERMFSNRPSNVGKGLSLADWHRVVQYVEACHGIKPKEQTMTDTTEALRAQFLNEPGQPLVRADVLAREAKEAREAKRKAEAAPESRK